uniref:Transposon protein, putative, CACTA, En/Spm sub-class n=1 Tax=Oryza sativa subsp. japonica TaxID=39947 RepID=Q2QQG5_ORYSJ|nr:transposon protein, putative, CACTA, En/Spm sub-class [Oryza sativa Japonica Group]
MAAAAPKNSCYRLSAARSRTSVTSSAPSSTPPWASPSSSLTSSTCGRSPSSSLGSPASPSTPPPSPPPASSPPQPPPPTAVAAAAPLISQAPPQALHGSSGSQFPPAQRPRHHLSQGRTPSAAPSPAIPVELSDRDSLVVMSSLLCPLAVIDPAHPDLLNLHGRGGEADPELASSNSGSPPWRQARLWPGHPWAPQWLGAAARGRGAAVLSRGMSAPVKEAIKLSDYERTLKKAFSGKSKPVPQLGEQPNQEIEPLVTGEDFGIEEFINDTGLTTDQLLGVAPIEKAEVKYMYELGKPLVKPELLQSLPTQIYKFHQLYMEMSATGREVIGARIRDTDFLQGDDILWINFKGIYELYQLDALDVSIMSCWILMEIQRARRRGVFDTGFIDPRKVNVAMLDQYPQAT